MNFFYLDGGGGGHNQKHDLEFPTEKLAKSTDISSKIENCHVTYFDIIYYHPFRI